jgi:signal transduction histidine kinase
MALVTDVSERRSLERAARQHEKLAALATFSAGIAHELNNPIGIISTRIEVMLQDAESQPLSPEVTEDLNVLHRNIQRVIRIARSLLSFARQSPEQRQLVSLNAVVDETLLLVGKQLGQDGIRIAVDLAPAVQPIWGDANALQQLVTNFLLNARDAMPSGGDLRIESAVDPARNGWVYLAVADTGDGMSAEQAARIWEPFYTTKRSGTGLGLSVSRRIIEEHGGTVEVSSELGRGTTFTLRFPIHADPPSR